MQGDQAKHDIVPDVAHADQCTSDNLLEGCVEGSKARLEVENSAAEELCNKVVENTRADDDVQVTHQVDLSCTGKFMDGTFKKKQCYLVIYIIQFLFLFFQAIMTSSKCLHQRLNKLTKKPEELPYR
jgi:hypothetical protein